jgi:Flp pilus assembly protein TadG
MSLKNALKLGKIRLLLAADRFRRETRGVAAVEFAFIAPILILLFIGTIELSAGVSVNRKLSRLSSTLSDLVTQSQTLTDNDINNIMDAATKVMYPYTDQVKITLTGIQITGTNASVTWSKAKNASPVAIGTSYSVPTKIKKDGTFLVAAKVETQYLPAFGWAHYSESQGVYFDRTAINMNEEIFLRPRIGSSVTIN